MNEAGVQWNRGCCAGKRMALLTLYSHSGCAVACHCEARSHLGADRSGQNGVDMTWVRHSVVGHVSKARSNVCSAYFATMVLAVCVVACNGNAGEFAVEGSVKGTFYMPDGRLANTLKAGYRFSCGDADYSIEVRYEKSGNVETETFVDAQLIYFSKGAQAVGGLTNQSGPSNANVVLDMAVVSSRPSDLARNCFLRVLWLTFVPGLTKAEISARYNPLRCGAWIEDEPEYEPVVIRHLDGAGQLTAISFLDSGLAPRDGNRQERVKPRALLTNVTTTNITGCLVPILSEFSIYYPASDSEIARVSERYSISVERFVTPPVLPRSPAPIGRVDVTDLRFQSEKLNRVVPLTYSLTNQVWLPTKDPFLRQRFEVFEAAELSKQRAVRKRQSRRKVVAAILVTLSAAAAWIIGSERRNRPKQS